VSRCELKAANGIHAACDEEECVYWRVAGHLDLVQTGTGCAIQYFELLGDEGGEIAAWLLSVRDRLEDELPESDAADTA
jgi:hypothetical protein